MEQKDGARFHSVISNSYYIRDYISRWRQFALPGRFQLARIARSKLTFAEGAYGVIYFVSTSRPLLSFEVQISRKGGGLAISQ